MKRTVIALSTLPLVVAFLALVRCGSSDVAGNGTLTGNAAVGVVYDFDGAPAPGATVKLVPVGADPRAAASVAATVVTGQDGRYSVSNLAAASYNVLADKQGRRGLVDSAVVGDSGVDTLPDAHLAATGSLAGVVKLMGAPVGASVYLLVLGTTSYAAADSSGRFALADMAGGSYRVRVLTTVTGYGPKDTVLSVRSGFADTLRDTIWINSSVIPVPTGLRVEYDTLRQIVTVRWDRADTALVKGYNVYRAHVDSGFVKFTATPVRDTVYRDSTARQDQSYTYQIKAVDRGGNEGQFSLADSVVVVGAYDVVDTLPKGLLAVVGGTVYVARDSGGTHVQVQSYDSRLQVLNALQLDSTLNQPQAFGLDSVGNLFFLDTRGLFRFTPQGALSDTIDLWSSRENKTIAVYDTLILLASGVIREYSASGSLLAAIDETPGFRADGLLVYAGHVLAGGNPNEIRVYDLNLQFVETWTLDFSHGETVWSLAKDEVGNIYVLGYSSGPDFCTMLIYDAARSYVGKIDVGLIAKDFVVCSGTIVLSQGDRLVVFRRKQ
jgi:hypothetical protein